jgi:hypothetical protein
VAAGEAKGIRTPPAFPRCQLREGLNRRCDPALAQKEVAHHKARRGTEGNAYALADWVKGKTLEEIVSVAEAYKKANTRLVTNSTVNRRLAVLRRVANLSYKRWGWLAEPLGQKIELLPENPHREEFFTRDELAVMLRAIPSGTDARRPS